jgi:hypothetical protein
MTVTDSPARQARIAELWQRRPGVPRETIEAQVDEQLAAEEAVAAENAARAEEFAASALGMMYVCAACRGTRSQYAADALCDSCRAVALVVQAERLFDEQIDGHSRRDLVEQYLAQQKAG